MDAWNCISLMRPMSCRHADVSPGRQLARAGWSGRPWVPATGNRCESVAGGNTSRQVVRPFSSLWAGPTTVVWFCPEAGSAEASGAHRWSAAANSEKKHQIATLPAWQLPDHPRNDSQRRNVIGGMVAPAGDSWSRPQEQVGRRGRGDTCSPPMTWGHCPYGGAGMRPALGVVAPSAQTWGARRFQDVHRAVDEELHRLEVILMAGGW